MLLLVALALVVSAYSTLTPVETSPLAFALAPETLPALALALPVASAYVPTFSVRDSFELEE